MRGEEDISACLPPPGRHAYLDARAVRRLVRKLQPGRHVSAHVEQRGDAWRLRLSFTGRDGVRVRRGITLPDAETALWVKTRIREAKEKRRHRTPSDHAGAIRRQSPSTPVPPSS